jgi:hypothetical protein
MFDQKPPQIFNHLKECFAFLFNEDTAQENSEGADIATQGEFFGRVGGVSGKFRETGGRSAVDPERMVSHGLF